MLQCIAAHHKCHYKSRFYSTTCSSTKEKQSRHEPAGGLLSSSRSAASERRADREVPAGVRESSDADCYFFSVRRIWLASGSVSLKQHCKAGHFLSFYFITLYNIYNSILMQSLPSLSMTGGSAKLMSESPDALSCDNLTVLVYRTIHLYKERYTSHQVVWIQTRLQQMF